MVWRLIYDEIKVVELTKIDGATSVDTDLYQIYESMTINECLDKINYLGLVYDTNESIVALVNSEIDEIKINKAKDETIKTHYDNIVLLISERILTNNINLSYLETQTILAEDNNIDLNYSGTPQTAVGGGLTVLHAKGQDLSSEIITDENGDWITNNDFKAKALTIPLYTPSSSSDNNGSEGNLTRDNNYLYLKTESGWKRTNLQSF
jgi:hypothetical protein